MIYLDNAATTYPKPNSVNTAVNIALRHFSANPGRSGHDMSMASAQEIFRCRERAVKLFNAENEENILFTLNCTCAINTVIKGLLKPGDHVVVSNLEHNAVMRPLQKLKERNISFSIANVYCGDNDKTLDSFRNAINSRTVLIICTQASNVWGIRCPVERLAHLGREYGIPILVDAAQSAGVIPIDMQQSGIDFLCTAGHKGLYGPMGTGMLITGKGKLLDTMIEGGTGTDSISFEQPNYMPDKFESGTPNTLGIIGLRAGMDFVLKKGVDNISRHEFKIIEYTFDKLSKMKKVKLYLPRPTPNYFVPLLSFNIENKNSESVASFLNKNKIEVRAGLHCAPMAHMYKNTLKSGAVRLCPSVFTTYNEIERFVYTLGRFI